MSISYYSVSLSKKVDVGEWVATIDDEWVTYELIQSTIKC